MESKSDKHTRVSTLNVRPSVAGIIADSDGNLDEKKAVAALSQTREQNKHMWIACFVLIGTVFVLIAANIGTSVAVARLTRQLNVDPSTGMATIPGSDDVVMKTSTAVFKAEDTSIHTASNDYLSALKTVEFNGGNISYDVKGYARMSNETILLVEGGSLIFGINGLKKITGDQPTRLFSSIDGSSKSSALNGRKLQLNHAGVLAGTHSYGYVVPSDYGYQACMDEERRFHFRFDGQPDADFGYQDCRDRLGPCLPEYCWSERFKCEREARPRECEEEARLSEEQHRARMAAYVPSCISCTLLGLGPQIGDLHCCRPNTGTVLYQPSCGVRCPDPAVAVLPLDIQENLVRISDDSYWSRKQQFS